MADTADNDSRNCGMHISNTAAACDHEVMNDGLNADESSGHESAAEYRKEAYTMALYVAICLLAALVATPHSDAEAQVIEIIWGITVGLAAAHWFAFRLSARLVGAGKVGSRDAASAGAQLVGAVAVALLTSAAVVLVPESVEFAVVEFLLGGFISLVGFAVARGGGATRIRALGYALIVLVVAVGVAALKNALAGH